MDTKVVLLSSRVWAKLTPDERESVLMENRLPLNSDGLSLADVNDFIIVLKAFQLHGVSRKRFGTLTVEIGSEELADTPKCPQCNRMIIDFDGEGTTCLYCGWSEGLGDVDLCIDAPPKGTPKEKALSDCVG